MKCRTEHGIELSLDEALLAMLREQSLDINLEAVIELFRPPSRYIEVPLVIENKVYESNTYEKGVPINTQEPVIINNDKVEIVTVNKQVPVFI